MTDEIIIGIIFVGIPVIGGFVIPVIYEFINVIYKQWYNRK